MHRWGMRGGGAERGQGGKGSACWGICSSNTSSLNYASTP